MNFKRALIGLGIVAVLGCGALLLFDDRPRMKRAATTVFMKSYAQSVLMYYRTNGNLPKTLTEVTRGQPAKDFFGAELDYQTSANPPQSFFIKSANLPKGSNSFVFQIVATNLVLLRVE